MLQGEARKILRRHGAKIAGPIADEIRASVAALDTKRQAENWEALEDEAEHLDELLHQHASFARKSALRETLENIGIAVGVALVLRSCIYEPYKIPSGSMIPTLQTGDHIFVNKFVYGVQIPFTNTVIGEDMIASIQRADVVVFRWPIDPSDDYIKRVIGLPGDTIRVDGRQLWIKKAGASDFERVERELLDEPCLSEDGTRTLENCQMYREHLGDHDYTVRFSGAYEGFTPAATYTVPEGHLFVMGDNRDESHDSRAWTLEAEAVSAESLISEKDLRDLTASVDFSQRRPPELGANLEPDRDAVMYLAEHRAPENNLELETWRNSTFGDRSVFEALTRQYDGMKPSTVAALVEAGTDLVGMDKDRTLEIGAEIDDLAVAETVDSRIAVWRHDPTKTVFRLTCGKSTCKTTAQLAKWTTDVLRRYHKDHDADAREMLPEDKSVRYSRHFAARDDVVDRFAEIKFSRGDTKAELVRLRAFRQPGQGMTALRDAALAAVGTGIDRAQAVADLGEDAWLVELDDQYTLVQGDGAKKFFTVLDCGKSQCGSALETIALGRKIRDRVPEAVADRRRMQTLLAGADLPGMKSLPVQAPSLNEWDRATFTGTRTGGTHSLTLEVERRPAIGIEARMAELRGKLREPSSVDGLGAEAWKEKGTRRYLFSVPATETIVSFECGVGLCPTDEVARGLAQRAAEKAENPRNFIDPQRAVSRPFVPRGNVKGRADMIWLPRARFGTKID